MKTLTQLHTYNVYTRTAYVHTKPGTRVDKCNQSFVVVSVVSKYVPEKPVAIFIRLCPFCT